MKKPTKQFKRMNDDELMQYAEQIVTKVGTENAIFPNPVPELETITAALTDFRLAATEAVHRDSRAIRIRNERRKELEYLISELAKYVDTIANNDAVIIQTSGYILSKDAVPFSGLVPKMKRLLAEPQGVGSLRIKLKADTWKGAHAYRFEFRKLGETTWNIQLSTKSSCEISGLEMFQQYEFRASYLGVNPEPNYSDIVISYVV